MYMIPRVDVHLFRLHVTERPILRVLLLNQMTIIYYILQVAMIKPKENTKD